MAEVHVGERGVRSLTVRQRDVANLIARHFAQKEIAIELRISESAVHKHVQAIKHRLGVNSLREIAEHLLADENSSVEGWRFSSSRKFRLSASPSTLANQFPDDPEGSTPGEPKAVNFMPSIPAAESPSLVPRLLDGKYRVAARAVVILLMILGSFAAIILAVSAVRSVSEIVTNTRPNLALKHQGRAS